MTAQTTDIGAQTTLSYPNRVATTYDTPTPALQQGESKKKEKASVPIPATIVKETPDDNEGEEDLTFTSDTNAVINWKQVGAKNFEIRDTEMGAIFGFLLMDIEGVDTEPDMLDDGIKGPWSSFVTEDCANQFSAKYGTHKTVVYNGHALHLEFSYENVTSPKAGASSASANNKSNERAIASALADIATHHIVFKIRDRSIANRMHQPRPLQKGLRQGQSQDAQGQPREAQDCHQRGAGQHLRQEVHMAPLRRPQGGERFRL
jgi:hypothetical protein